MTEIPYTHTELATKFPFTFNFLKWETRRWPDGYTLGKLENILRSQFDIDIIINPDPWEAFYMIRLKRKMKKISEASSLIEDGMNVALEKGIENALRIVENELENEGNPFGSLHLEEYLKKNDVKLC